MPHPYVTQVTFKDGQIVLTVQVDEFLSDESVEISGYATQNGGAFATFYDIQPVKENPDGTVLMYVAATPSKEFTTDEDVTVVLRAARVWVTVLTGSQAGRMASKDQAGLAQEGSTAQEGTTWNNVTAVGWASAGLLSTWGTGQTSAGSDTSFPGT